MRLFFAAMLPESIQQSLAKLRTHFNWLPTPASWSAAQNIHITLKFLGEVPDEQVSAIASGLVLPAAGPLKLQLSHPVLFPDHGAVRVLGAGFEGDTDRLIQLQDQIEQYCRSMGFTRESRRYIPHATLARFREGLRATHRPRMEQALANLRTIPAFELTELQLMQSELSPKGSRYTALARYPL